MNSKVLMLSVAVIAVGLFALPSTLSMFAGQHSWYDPKISGGIPCAKCHFLELDELSGSGGPHDPLYYNGLVNTTMNYGEGPGKEGGATFWGADDSIDDRCYGCHQRAGSNSTHWLAGSWDDHRDKKHAAIAVWCIDCHPWVETELTHPQAAHRWFYDNLNDTTTGEPDTNTLALQQPNRACLGCHTHVGVNITWQRNAYVSYNVTCDALGGTLGGYGVAWNTSDPLGMNTSRFSSTPGYT